MATNTAGYVLVIGVDGVRFDYLGPDATPFDRTLAILVNRKELQAHVLIGIREDYLAKLDRLRPRFTAIPRADRA